MPLSALVPMCAHYRVRRCPLRFDQRSCDWSGAYVPRAASRMNASVLGKT